MKRCGNVRVKQLTAFDVFGMLDPNYVPWLRTLGDWMAPRMVRHAVKVTRAADLLMGARPKEQMYKLRRLVEVDGVYPTVGENCFIAPNAVVLGISTSSPVNGTVHMFPPKPPPNFFPLPNPAHPLAPHAAWTRAK